jgi:hypothetical protein
MWLLIDQALFNRTCKTVMNSLLQCIAQKKGCKSQLHRVKFFKELMYLIFFTSASKTSFHMKDAINWRLDVLEFRFYVLPFRYFFCKHKFKEIFLVVNVLNVKVWYLVLHCILHLKWGKTFISFVFKLAIEPIPQCEDSNFLHYLLLQT